MLLFEVLPNVPGGHCVQIVAPDKLYVPGKQSVHMRELSAPVILLKVPGLQNSQVDEPVLLLYLPERHGLQIGLVWSSIDMDVPMGHGMHCGTTL